MFAMAGALPVSAGNTKTLKDVLGRYFLVGAAMNVDQIWNRTPDETNVVKNNFNSIVAENCMKGEEIHPEENRFFWALIVADCWYQGRSAPTSLRHWMPD